MVKGPKFCPSTKGNFLHAKADTQDFTRKLKLMEKFHDSDYQDPSLVKHPSKLNIRCDNDELATIISRIDSCAPTVTNIEDNLTQTERQALKQLKSFTDIIIKKADKGNTLVILDTEFYRDKLVLADHLNTDTYSIAPANADKKVFKDLKTLMKKYEKCFTNKEMDYILNEDWKSSNFYVLPKIHKNSRIKDKFKNCNSEYVHMDVPNDLKGRPITAGPCSPTRGLSELLERLLSPFVSRLKTYVKDDRDFLSRLPRFIDYDCELLSCDIISLYTNIQHDLGIDALRYWLSKYPELIPRRFTIEFILEAAAFVLKNNNFMFDGVCRHQEIGTAMGTVFAPPYACLSIGYLEETKLEPTVLPQYFSPEDVALIMYLLLRYIDDGFTPWPKRLNKDNFITALNSLHPQIKFTIEEGKYETERGVNIQVLPFLDVKVILHDSGRVETDIFYKETNSHDYLNYFSHHPTHTKDNIVYGLAKKIVEFVSDYDREEQRLRELHDFLIACNYPGHVVRKGIRNARLQGPGPDPENKRHTIPFVTTNCSNLNSQRTVKLANELLQGTQNERLQNVFKNSKIVMALKQPPNLLKQLSRAEFNSTTTPQEETGIFVCGRSNCELCKRYLKPCTSFTTSNSTEWHVKSKITCHSKHVIYFLKCRSCNGNTTYTGKTNNLRKRMNCHISECRSGITSDRFDKHVHRCNSTLSEPFFDLFVFVEVKDVKLLDAYEKYLHQCGYDTMNR